MTSDAKDEMRKQRALDCRTLRMYIVAHPGSTGYEICQGTGIKNDDLLLRLEAMEFIRSETKKENGRLRERWYVVPK